MLYEQLCGRRPFTGLNTEEVLNRIAEGKPRRPTEFDPSVPLALELVCLTALSKDPSRRFPSLHEFIAAIEAVGGPARVATPDEVAAYVSAIFPAEEDPKRIALRRARLADPSTPTRSPDATAIDLLPPREESRPPRKVEQPAPPTGPSPWQRWAAWARQKLLRVEVLGPRGARAGGGGRRDRLRHPARALGRRPAPAGGEGLHAGAAHPRARPRWPRIRARPRPSSGGPVSSRCRARTSRARSPSPRPSPGASRSRIEAALQEARACVGPPAGEAGRRGHRPGHRPRLRTIPGRTCSGRTCAGSRAMPSGMLEALTSASRKAPNDREIAVRRGELLSQAGRLDEASAVLNAVLRHRFHPGAAAELGFVKLRQNQSADAMRLLRAVAGPLAQPRQGALLPGRGAHPAGRRRARPRPSTAPRTGSPRATRVRSARCARCWPRTSARRRPRR